MKWTKQPVVALAMTFLMSAAPHAQQQAERPNIVIIWGDDIGQSNVSAYSHGLRGYKTPNIDRLAKEGGQLQSRRSDEKPPGSREVGSFEP